MTSALMVRRGNSRDIPALLDIQTAAGGLFAGLGVIATPDGTPEAIPVEAFELAAMHGLLFIAEKDRRCVGFALCSIERPDLYLDQLSVTPDAGRQGAGAALLEHVAAEASTLGLWGVSLSTFRSVPWNGPFFARHGFEEVPRAGLALWQLDIERAQSAIMDVAARCFMRRPAIRAFEALAA